MPGDFIAHGIPLDPNKPLKGNYELLREIHKQSVDLVHKVYPNAIFVPALGNNDFKYHYQCPTSTDKYEQYSFLFDLWFSKSDT